jgi:hypothetical protein
MSVIAEAKTASGAVREISEHVGTEGVVIILAVLGGLSALIALVIIFPKVKKLINRFIGKWWMEI